MKLPKLIIFFISNTVSLDKDESNPIETLGLNNHFSFESTNKQSLWKDYSEIKS